MRHFFHMTLLALVALSPLTTFALGKEGGGGDLCEDRIKVIRDDLRSWIVGGGPAGLTLPRSLSVVQYSSSMLSAISSAKISCVGQGDLGFPVQVEGTPKVCVFSKDDSKSKITCDIAKFMAMKESDQYVLTHHEYAGISDIEKPDGADSHYEISNQIDGFLQDTLVKKLAIHPNSGIVSCLPLYKPKEPRIHEVIDGNTYDVNISCDYHPWGVTQAITVFFSGPGIPETRRGETREFAVNYDLSSEDTVTKVDASVISVKLDDSGFTYEHIYFDRPDKPGVQRDHFDLKTIIAPQDCNDPDRCANNG